MTARPTPYPAATRSKGWRFELDVERIQQSDTWALAAPMARPWLLMIWTVAWQQVPCGSLPSDDELIVARLGIEPEFFAAHRKVLLRGWWLAEDGRLYHDTIVDCVMAMLAARDKERARKAEYRARQEALRAAASVPPAPAASTPPGGGEPPDDPGNPWASQACPTGQLRDSDGSDDTRTRTRTRTSITPLDADTHGARELSHGTPARTVTPAAQVCFAMRAAGLGEVNPSHPNLSALLAAGAELDEFKEAAKEAARKGRGFAYALGIVSGRRKEAAALAQQVHQGAMPAKPRSRGEEISEATALALGVIKVRPGAIDVDAREVAQ